jgi:hypothetical protein
LESLQRIWFSFWDKIIGGLQLNKMLKGILSDVLLFVVISTGFAAYWRFTSET